jgi:hypothetical protein
MDALFPESGEKNLQNAAERRPKLGCKVKIRPLGQPASQRTFEDVWGRWLMAAKGGLGGRDGRTQAQLELFRD